MVIVYMILQTAFTVVIVSMVARFLAQMARADFYNPLAQTVVKITDPFIKPLRRIIPSIAGLDVASLVGIFLAQMVFALLILLLSGNNPGPIMAKVLVWTIISVPAIILTVLQWSMILVAIASIILMGQYNPFIAFVNQMIEPFVGPFRKLNLQVGMLDLSFMLAIMVIFILKDVILIDGVAQFVGYSTRNNLFIGL